MKTTGRLYGEDIEEKKWIVDGRDNKPTLVMVVTFGRLAVRDFRQ